MNKLGFGFLRFEKTGEDYDWAAISAMADAFLEKGGRYFDTCYTYLDGASEEAIRRCVVERHPRDQFQICDKIPGYLCKTEEDAAAYLETMQKRCGTDYFDVLMLHWLNRKNYQTAEALNQFAFLEAQKKAGKALRIGFSYHDSAALLDQILTRHPQVDVVQIQLNYLDWESAGIQARLCYETCVKHGKQVIVMEPLRGGTLTKLPPQALEHLQQAHPDWSPAKWGLAFAMAQPQVETVLSGMNSVSQVEENRQPFPLLTDSEIQLLISLAEEISGSTAVPCTACRYCVSHCPRQIPIPRYFAMYNEVRAFPEEDWKIRPSYETLAAEANPASACIACGACAAHCPQQIAIPDRLKEVETALEG